MNPNEYLSKRFDLHGNSPRFIKGSRWDTLPSIFKDLGYTVGAEIGVELGRFSRSLCRKVPNLKLYGIDPWVSYDDQFTKRDPDVFYKKTVEDCKGFNVELIRKFSMDAVGDFDDESLDFVYIDGNHDFPHVVEDIANWSKKVRVGGIVSGHDYVFERKLGAHAGYAVRDWTDIFKIKPWYVIDETTKKQHGGRPSWFWVRN